jgi:lysophospholipase L1-like esterase
MLRVFMVGESTVQGFPYPQNLCAASFLEKMLQQQVAPGTSVEVINTGITAIASFPLRRLVREICTLQPDLIIIYAGHNEYYGAFGVASAQSVGTGTWSMQFAEWWRSTGIGQGLLAASEKVADARARRTPATKQTSETLMELMGTSALIAPDAPLRNKAEESLRANIGAMIAAAKSAKVPVIVCSLAANERDLVPIRSVAPANEPELSRWNAALDQARDAMSSGPAVARPLWQKVAEQFPQSAVAQLYVGRMCELQEDTTAARTAFRNARDLDAMPWRATSSLNDMLRQLATEQGATFCDVDAAFHRDALEHGEAAPGWRLFADHLHPSLDGQALFARALVQDIRVHKVLPLGTDAKPADWRTLASQLGENRLVHWRVGQLMASLFQRPPLEKDTAAFRHANRARQEALAGAADYETRAADRYVTQTMEGRQPWSVSFVGGEEAMRAHQNLGAALYFDSAAQEAVKFSPERSLAAYYGLLAQVSGRGALTTATIELAKRQVSEATYILAAETDPAVHQGLLHVLTGLSLLADDPASAKKWAKDIPEDSALGKQVIGEVKQIEQLRVKRLR